MIFNLKNNNKVIYNLSKNFNNFLQSYHEPKVKYSETFNSFLQILRAY